MGNCWNHAKIRNLMEANSIGFYYADNDYIDFLNFIISCVACRIYKYKMFCRIESLDEINVY